MGHLGIGQVAHTTCAHVNGTHIVEVCLVQAEFTTIVYINVRVSGHSCCPSFILCNQSTVDVQSIIRLII